MPVKSPRLHLGLGSAHTLLLASTAELLLAVLLLLTLLAANVDARLLNVPRLDETVLRLVLLGSIHAVVHEGEAGALATTEGGLHAEDHSGVGAGLVALALDRYSASMPLSISLSGVARLGWCTSRII